MKSIKKKSGTLLEFSSSQNKFTKENVYNPHGKLTLSESARLYGISPFLSELFSDNIMTKVEGGHY